MKATLIINQKDRAGKLPRGQGSYTQIAFELDEGDYVRLEREVTREDQIWPLTENYRIEDLIIKK